MMTAVATEALSTNPCTTPLFDGITFPLSRYPANNTPKLMETYFRIRSSKDVLASNAEALTVAGVGNTAHHTKGASTC
jgi:hypothetical protein